MRPIPALGTLAVLTFILPPGIALAEKCGRGGANCHTGSRSATLRHNQVGE
jgi:hypothetical protein